MLEARQRLETLVIPKRQALTRLQGLLATLLHLAEMAFPQQIKTSIFKLIGYIAPEVLAKMAENQLELPPREFQILKQMYNGLFNNEIALQLNILPKTTNKHRENMMPKLQVNNATQLLKKVIALGLLKSGSS